MGNDWSLCRHEKKPLQVRHRGVDRDKGVVHLDDPRLPIASMKPIQRTKSLKDLKKKKQTSKVVDLTRVMPVGVEFSKFYVEQQRELGFNRQLSFDPTRNKPLARPSDERNFKDSVNTCGVE